MRASIANILQQFNKNLMAISTSLVQHLTIPTVSSALRNLSIQSVSHPKIKLRHYQQDAIDAIHASIAKGVRRPAVVLATGGGKTVVFSHLIPQISPSTPGRGNKTLVLAHKEELVRQAASTIAAVNPDLKVSIDMRTAKPHPEADVIVASVPTLIRMTRLEKYDPNQFKTIILDECHHATANSWVKILQYFQANSAELAIFVIGFTATMERSDGKSLGTMFDEIVYQRSLLEMVKNGELVDIKFSTVNANIDLSKVKIRSNDYEIASLSKAMNHVQINTLIALSYIKLKKQYNFANTLIFCVDIDHCKTLCGVLQSQGINAQYVTGLTSKLERQSIIQDFKDGKIQVLCNVQVFTEGTDIPNIDSLILARPTKSRTLLVQMVGRGLRLHQDKSVCHVIDIVDTIGTGIQSVPTLFDLPANYEIHGKTYKEILEEKTNFDEIENAKLAREKELERRLLEKETNESLATMQLDPKNAFKFTTIDGFMALEDKTLKEYETFENARKAFQNSKIQWNRLEYSLWGYGLDDQFYLVKRIEQDGQVLFHLTLHQFATLEELRASNFKCVRQRLVGDFGFQSDLKALLIKVDSSVSQMQGSFALMKRPQLKITARQLSYLSKKLRVKVKQMYGEDMQQELAEKLTTLTRNQATQLIFAVKYSISSLCIRWELLKLLGPDKKAKSTMTRLLD